MDGGAYQITAVSSIKNIRHAFFSNKSFRHVNIYVAVDPHTALISAITFPSERCPQKDRPKIRQKRVLLHTQSRQEDCINWFAC